MKIEEKLERAEQGKPNVLLLSQYADLPFPQHVVELVPSYWEQHGAQEPRCWYCGLLFFDRFRLVKFYPNPAARSESHISNEHLELLVRGFKVMYHPRDWEGPE